MGRSGDTRPALGTITFFVIAFGVPWTGWIILRRSMPLDAMFDSFRTVWFTAAPSVAGFAAAFVEGGAKGLRDFCRRVLSCRVPFAVWLLAIVLPLAAALLTFAGHPADLTRGGPPKWAALLGSLALMNFFTGPLAEEFGWRGFLLQRLAHYRLHPVWIGVLIAPIWALWHLPIFYDTVYAHPVSAIGYLGWLLAWSVVLALIVTLGKGSVLPAILAHWAINASAGLFFALLPRLPGERQPGGVAMSVTSLVVALVFAAVYVHSQQSGGGLPYGADREEERRSRE